MNDLTQAMVTIFGAIIGVAVLSVIVSKKADTANVLGAFGSMFSNSLSAATGPVTGAVAAPVNSVGAGLGGLSLNQLTSNNFQLPGM